MQEAFPLSNADQQAVLHKYVSGKLQERTTVS